jgi:hypothetical protein
VSHLSEQQSNGIDQQSAATVACGPVLCNGLQRLTNRTHMLTCIDDKAQGDFVCFWKVCRSWYLCTAFDTDVPPMSQKMSVVVCLQLAVLICQCRHALLTS